MNSSRSCKVILRTGEVVSVENYSRAFNTLAEFDHRGNHYCVRVNTNDKFDTLIGELNEEGTWYTYKKCSDFEVTKIFVTEELSE